MSRTKRDWTLLAIALAEGEPISPVQLQKALFLLGRRLPADVLPQFYYDFRADNYGPFDGEIYDDARELESEGLVRSHTRPGLKFPEYHATARGVQAVREHLLELHGEGPRARAIVSWVRSQTFGNLVRAIYKEYPEFQINSIFQG